MIITDGMERGIEKENAENPTHGQMTARILFFRVRFNRLGSTDVGVMIGNDCCYVSRRSSTMQAMRRLLHCMTQHGVQVTIRPASLTSGSLQALSHTTS